MKLATTLLCALAVFALTSCAGMYVGGDTGAGQATSGGHRTSLGGKTAKP